MQPIEISAIAGSISAGVAGVALIVASISARAAVRSSRNTAKALEDAEKRAIQQMRPIVVAELRRTINLQGEPVQGLQDLVVRNCGTTPARWLTISLNPRIQDPTPPEQPAGGTTSALVRRFAKTVPTLAPGVEMANIYTDLHAKVRETPDQLAVTVAYKDMAGNGFTDVFNLDVHDIGLSTFAQRRSRG